MTPEQRRSYKYQQQRAHSAVAMAGANGDLIKQPCERCGLNAEAHHDDYRELLAVRWLCFNHHRQWHTTNGYAQYDETALPSDDFTVTDTLSFRLPERLVKRIDAQADKETRLRTNMVQVLLQEALDKRESETSKR